MRRLCLTGMTTLMAWLVVLVAADTSSGRATVGTFYDQHVETFSTTLPECLPPDLIGTSTGTETTTGHFTENTNSFHFEGTTTFAYRVDFPDGRHVVGSAVSHFAFNASTSGQTTSMTVTREPRTIYDADGQPEGRVVIHALSHITYRDSNANGTPDSGEIRASVDRFFFTCG